MRDLFYPGNDPTSADEDSAFVDYLAVIQEQIRRGVTIDLEFETAAHPSWAGKLRELFPVLEMMNDLQAPSPRELFIDVAGTLGDFRNVREIGRGGMGVVYEAVQESLNRPVALKILSRIDTADPIKIRRFHIEAQAAACLNHPHIVPVYTFGREGSVHFYAMRLIEGVTLAERISKARRSGARVPFRESAEMARQAADAIQFAHDQGIIHRDVKPSNLLIEPSGWLWVADFGLARLPGAGDLTGTGVLMGTLRYTSPEQALGNRGVVDHRTDVYALGATLYEMITLRPVFAGDGRLALLRQIEGVEPKSPRRIDPTIPFDLETITMKALSKNADERYATAKDFAEDLTRFLEHRPILAKPPGLIGHMTRWCRRHRTIVAAATLFLLATTMGLVAVAEMHRRHNVDLSAALAHAAANEKETKRLAYGYRVRLAQRENDDGRVEFVQDLLEQLRPAPGEDDSRGFEWHYLRRVAHQEVSFLVGHKASVYALAVSPDARSLVSGDREGVLIFWDLDDWRERARCVQSGRMITGLTFAPNGRRVASLSEGHNGKRGSDVRIIDPTSGRATASVPSMIKNVTSLCFDANSETLIVSGDDGGESRLVKHVEFWKITSDGTLSSPQPARLDCRFFCISKNKRIFAWADESGRVVVSDTSTGLELKTLEQRFPRSPELAFTPDGGTLALNDGEEVSFWDPPSGRRRGRPQDSTKGLGPFSFDRELVASFPIRRGASARIADPKNHDHLIDLEAVPGRPLFYAFSDDGSTVATGGERTPATIWDAITGKKREALAVKMVNVHCLTFTPDNRSLIFAGEDKRIRFWHVNRLPAPRDYLEGHEKEVWSLAYAKDGKTLFSGADDHTIKAWDPRTGALKATMTGHGSLVTSITVSPDGATLASVSFDGSLRLWSTTEFSLQKVLTGHGGRIRTVAFSPDGRRIATGATDKTVRLWEISSGKELRKFGGLTSAARSLAFDPNGRTLAVADDRQNLLALDAETLLEVRAPVGLSIGIATLAYSPDANTLAIGDEGGGVTLWDAKAWIRRKRFRVTDLAVWSLRYSTDGKSLAAGCGDANVRIVSPVTGQELLVLAGHSDRVNAVNFSPDGQALASASHDGSICLWNASENEEIPTADAPGAVAR